MDIRRWFPIPDILSTNLFDHRDTNPGAPGKNSGPTRARAASGHATADPAIPVMKSRRRISLTKARTTPNGIDYSRDLWPAEWAPTVILRGNNPVGRMSALGQKQTFGSRKAMSALPPKADMEASMTGETVSVVRANRRLLARIASVKVQNSFGIPVRVHDGK